MKSFNEFLEYNKDALNRALAMHKFKKKGGDPKDYPQLSVQDYSEVKEDDMGKYVKHVE